MKNIIQLIREHKFTEAEDRIDSLIPLIMEKKIFEMKKAVAAKMSEQMGVGPKMQDKRESGVVEEEDRPHQLNALEKLKDAEVIEVFALAYMRGMNIDNAILIFEEAQNSTPSQMKLLLTRIGFNSKFFISGDLEQTDRYKDKTQSGLWDVIEKFKNVNDIGVFEFNDKDIVRNPLISQILSKYEE